MDYHLPEEFDVIIVGTGMVESILSAASSRIGKRVLHLDKNDYYGGHWASFNLNSLEKLQEKFESVENLPDDSGLIHFTNNIFSLTNFNFKWFVPNSENIKSEDDITKNEFKEEQNKEIWTKDTLQQLSRKFNIDLAPKLQYARGDLIELLISSNIARYSEYRSVSRVLVWLNEKLEIVPCSRSDVFSNNKVTVIEKRMLMKLLTSLDNESEELKKYENKTFREFLKDKKLTPNLVHYVLYAISMSNDETSCYEGVRNTKRFLNSLGRFGKTPFLFSMFGSGDITQAFCRLSAVFGGVFALGQTLSGFTVDDNKFKSITVGKQKIQGEYLVMNIENGPEKYVQSVTRKYISRCILVTDKSVMESEKEHLTLLLYPPENGKNSTTVIELGSLTGTCPKDLYLVHLISVEKDSPEKDFEHILNKLFNCSELDSQDVCKKPSVLCACYFSLPDTNEAEFKVPNNIFLTPGPDSDLDYDISIFKAKELFEKMYPNEEFLPRAPDPEEIVIEGDDDKQEE